MLKAKLLALLIVTFKICHAQDVDINRIKTVINDTAHQYHYPKLIAEFVSQPQYFSMEKGIYLYYGNLYSPDYKSLDFKTITMFAPLVEKGRLKKAILVGEELFKENPVNLGLLLRLGFCYKQSKQPEKETLTREMAAVLIRAIESSGDGSSAEKAYKVISVTDEYVIMDKNNWKRKTRTSKQMESSVFDIWESGENNSTLYFEVLYNAEKFVFPK
ncbi:DUF4919 domain-containing protein [Dyadobacter crusticola]|uniref:DUF4919 domain-containing protein n=1 Tax=Dyadobacter crusticola TaxID=292407 RepID=UPI0004E0FC9C|nr:DUF4919 domain-containing protein [Dyadobacter crusticola]